MFPRCLDKISHEHSRDYMVEIYRRRNGEEESYVVRWCSECGAVVVDTEYDGRTQPGSVREMKFPKTLISLLKNS